MAKQSKKAGVSKGRKNVQVKDLSKSTENVSRKQMKNIKGGTTSNQDMTVTKQTDKGSSTIMK